MLLTDLFSCYIVKLDLCMCTLHTLDTSKEYMTKSGCTSIAENSKLKFSLSLVSMFRFCYHHEIMALMNLKN